MEFHRKIEEKLREKLRIGGKSNLQAKSLINAKYVANLHEKLGKK